MLILSRKIDEKIKIGDDITITLIDVHGDQVKIGIEAPKNTKKHEVKKPDPFDCEPEPITITVENVISEIQDYFKRQLEGEEGLHRINTLNAIKDDLIALFEAYQHN